MTKFENPLGSGINLKLLFAGAKHCTLRTRNSIRAVPINLIIGTKVGSLYVYR